MDEKEIYKAVLSRLSATELEQHYVPMFAKRLEDARVKLVEALAAVQQLQETRESVAKLGHPESHVVMEESAELMPLASKAIEVQKQLLAAIELRMVPSEHPQVSRKRPRSRSPPIKIERMLQDSTDSSNTTGRVVAMHDPNEATDDREVFHEHVQNCTRLVDHAASLPTVLCQRDYLDELVPEVLNALYFLSDNARADFWRDRSVRSDLWDLQGCVNSTISLTQDVGTYDQLARYLTLLFIEVCYLMGNFDHFREYFVGCRQRIANLRQRRKHQIRSMESTEKEWKGTAVRALRNARRVSGEQDAAARERRVQATCLDLIAVFTRIDDEPRLADCFLGEDELIYLREAVEIAVESIMETRVRDALNARFSTCFLDAMKRATQRFERLRVLVHR